MERRNPYLILGVRESATAEEISRRYKDLTLIHHPDRNPGDAGAVSRMVEINAAYGELKTPERRAAVDRELLRARIARAAGPDKIRNVIVKARDWLTRDPLGKIVANTILNALEKQGARGESPPRASAQRADPRAKAPSSAPTPSAAPAPSAPPSASPKKRASAKKSASTKKRASPKKSSPPKKSASKRPS